ncbi:hypothetical protein BVX98_05730 [bacterium F11]|nr:hypothetical protein BVX98_05730 [bacterium F11]
MRKKGVFLIFAIIGIGALIWGTTSYKKAQEAKGWPTTEGKIISSEVDSHWSRTGTGTNRRSKMMYDAKVVFEYSVEGRVYTSNKVSFGEYSSSSRRSAQKVVEKYPPNKDVIVFFDPVNPEMAILEPGKIGGIVIPFVAGGMFLLVGIVGVMSKKNT